MYTYNFVEIFTIHHIYFDFYYLFFIDIFLNKTVEIEAILINVEGTKAMSILNDVLNYENT